MSLAGGPTAGIVSAGSHITCESAVYSVVSVPWITVIIWQFIRRQKMVKVTTGASKWQWLVLMFYC